MKNSLRILATAIATPAMAHEIASDHAHVGESVLFHLSPMLAFGAGMAALAAYFILRARHGGKADEGRDDSR